MKIKYLLTGILIGVVLFPTVTLGGSFVSSLIDGKTPAEAVTILAEQIDVLIGRVEILESRADREEACREADRLFFYIPPEPESVPEGWYRLASHTNNIVELYNAERDRDPTNPDFTQFIAPAYDEYLSAKVECEQ